MSRITITVCVLNVPASGMFIRAKRECNRLREEGFFSCWIWFVPPLPRENLVMGVSGLDTCWILREQIQMHKSQLFLVYFCVRCMEIQESHLVLSRSLKDQKLWIEFTKMRLFKKSV